MVSRATFAFLCVLSGCRTGDPNLSVRWRCEGSGFVVDGRDVEELTNRSWDELVAPWTGVREVSGRWRRGEAFSGLLLVSEREAARDASYDCDGVVALVHTEVDVTLRFDDGSPPLTATGPLRWYHLRPEGPGLVAAKRPLAWGQAGWLWLSVRDGRVRGGGAEDGPDEWFEGSF